MKQQRDSKGRFVSNTQKEKDKYIPINIWDDFWDDGYVPKNQTQSTYAYVESDDFTLEQEKKAMLLLCSIIKESKLLDESLYKIKIKTFQNEWTNNGKPYERYEVIFKNITHEKLNKLMKILTSKKHTIDGIPIKFYSES